MSALSNQKFPFADAAALNPMTTPPLPEQIELHRDRMWRRDEDLRVESAVDAERFIEDVGFAKLRSLTPALSQWEREPYADRCPSRRSIVPYIAVCGRRDVSLPRHVQARRVNPDEDLVVEAQRAIDGWCEIVERLADRDGDGAAFTDRFDDALLRWV